MRTDFFAPSCKFLRSAARGLSRTISRESFSPLKLRRLAGFFCRAGANIKRVMPACQEFDDLLPSCAEWRGMRGDEGCFSPRSQRDCCRCFGIQSFPGVVERRHLLELDCGISAPRVFGFRLRTLWQLLFVLLPPLTVRTCCASLCNCFPLCLISDSRQLAQTRKTTF